MQYALPLKPKGEGPARIVVGSGNEQAVEALRDPAGWPFGTAILTGPPRSGKSLLATWFDQSGAGRAIDDAHLQDETQLFHSWNRAQAEGEPLLLVAGQLPWDIALPDLRSRLAAALWLDLSAPDDALVADLIQEHANARGLALDDTATRYLIPRMTRSYAGIERLVAEIDRISLERKSPPGQSVWRAALEAVEGPEAPRLL